MSPNFLYWRNCFQKQKCCRKNIFNKAAYSLYNYCSQVAYDAWTYALNKLRPRGWKKFNKNFNYDIKNFKTVQKLVIIFMSLFHDFPCKRSQISIQLRENRSRAVSITHSFASFAYVTRSNEGRINDPLLNHDLHYHGHADNESCFM